MPDFVPAQFRRRVLWIFVAAWVAHAPGLFGKFLDWDDSLYVEAQKRIQSLTLANLKDILDPRLTASDPFPEYQPVRDLSLAIDYAVWGPNAFGFKLTNLFFHALNSVLVCLLLGGMFCMWPVALLTGLLFAIHPVHVESVAWVSSRKDVLGLFFSLLSCLFFLQGERLKRPALWAGSVLCLALGLLSKSQAVTVPCILAAIVFVRNDPKRLAAVVPHALLVLASVLHFLDIQFTRTPIGDFYGRGFEADAAATVQVFARYAWHVLWPASLSPYYDLNAELKRIDPAFWMSVGWAAAFFVAALHFFKRQRPVSICLMLFLIQLLPVLNLLPHPIWIADRYLYFSAMFLTWPLALGVCELHYHFGRKVLTAFALILLTLTALSWRDSWAWTTSRRLWARVLVGFPDARPARMNYGNALREEGAYAEARTFLEGALSKYPGDGELFVNLGTVLHEKGDLGAAVKAYDEALRVNPKDVSALFNRSRALTGLDRRSEAREGYARCVKIQPSHIECRAHLGGLLAREGMYDAAKEQWMSVVSLEPDHEATLYDLCVLAGRRGDFASARSYFERLRAVAPEHPGIPQLEKLLGVANGR